MLFRKFSRFKYAEEFAHAMDTEGVASWKMWRAPDELEDGYDIPVYVVEYEPLEGRNGN